MKFTAAIVSGLVPLALAQELGPAPTESYGCEPHGDHYHCEGHVSETAADAASTTVTVTSATPEATGDHDEEHDHDHGDEEHGHSDEEIASAGPSPTESTGCEPHGDHWDCEAAATPSGTATTTASVTVTESLAPSPTESTGCEPHGDHWHCEEARESGEEGSAEETTSAEATPTGGVAAQVVPLAGAAIAAAFAL